MTTRARRVGRVVRQVLALLLAGLAFLPTFALAWVWRVVFLLAQRPPPVLIWPPTMRQVRPTPTPPTTPPAPARVPDPAHLVLPDECPSWLAHFGGRHES